MIPSLSKSLGCCEILCVSHKAPQRGKGLLLFFTAVKCDCYREQQSALKGHFPVIQVVCSGNFEAKGSDLCFLSF